MSTPLLLRTLGGLSIVQNEIPLTTFDSRKVAALLVYLACAGREQPREVLAEMLWEGRSQAQALSNLRVALTSLRQTVGDFVTITRETAGMAPDGGWWLDAAAFEAHLGAGQPEEALAVYGGDFLAGFYIDSGAFEDWATLERERLKFRAMEALDGLIATCLEGGNYADGVNHATRLFQMDPLREETHRAMMALLARSGQRAAALAQFETCRRLLRGDLGIDPAPETAALYEQIKAGKLAGGPPAGPPPEIELMAVPVARRRLPAQATRFIGREAEIAAVIGQVRDPACRLLTLLGPGGIGKTRLAVAAAERLLEDFPHGVYFVDLAPVSDPEAIPQAVAGALGFQFYPGGEPPRQQLLNYLRDKTLLLIFDNCEHLLDGIALLDAILATAPGVTILATSREALRLAWEWVIPVEGLPFEAADTEAAGVESDAARLFIDRARRRQAAFDPAGHADAIRRVCQGVGGMPLGIELAAARTAVLPVEVIADEIGHSLDLLESERRGVPDRQRSIRAVFDPTWARLSPAEQAAFMRLSVFRGGFTREAAQAVAGANLHSLTALVEGSLLRFEAKTGRYSLHELLRQYAAERLEAAGQTVAAADAHSHYYLTALEEEALFSSQGLEVLAAIESEIEDIRAAWLHAAECGRVSDLRAAISCLSAAHYHRGWWRESAALYARAVEALEAPNPQGDQAAVLGFLLCLLDPDVHVPCLVSQSPEQINERGIALLRRAGTRPELRRGLINSGALRLERRIACREEALALARQEGYRPALIGALWVLGLTYSNAERLAEAEPLLVEALTLAREGGHVVQEYLTSFVLALQRSKQGREREALAIYQAIVPAFRRLGNSHYLYWSLNNLALLASQLGLYDEAEQAARESVAIVHDLLPETEGGILDTLAEVKYARGQYAEARRIREQALRLYEKFALNNAAGMAYIHKQMGFDACALGDRGDARDHLRVALDRLHDLDPTECWPQAILIDTILGVALLSAVEGRLERAVELLALAARYPDAMGADRHAQDEVRLRDELKAELPPEVFRAAWVRGEAIPLEGLVAALLAELG